MSTKPPSEFEKIAASGEGERLGFLGELWAFLRDNKKWWLAPILVVLLLFGLLVFATSSGLAPFIYTLF